MNILGISGLYHDSAAALVTDGRIVSAVQEERFTRIKNDKSFPTRSIEYCLAKNRITAKELDAVVFYDDPLLTLDRFLDNCIKTAKKSDSLIQNQYESMFAERLRVHKLVKECSALQGFSKQLLVCRHHISHAAGAFFESPFCDAAILVIDGVGEWNTTTLGVGENNSIKILKKVDYPDSLGLLYSAFTYFCGFKVNSGEYKLMGLAPYGKPIYTELIKKELVDIKEDGSYKLNMKNFEFQYGRVMVGKAFEDIFGCKIRKPDEPFDEIYLDLAASIQAVTEEIILKMARHLKKITNKKNLCIAGGVALNCTANGKLLKEKIFENIFIQPAAGDAGGSVGAALYTHYVHFKNERSHDRYRNNVFLGPSYSNEEICETLEQCNAVFYFEPNLTELLSQTAKMLADDKVVGFFQGGMEFGPRALGHRSILANPTNKEMQKKLNLKIKFRESFRPFAPSVLKEYAEQYFDIDAESPFMLITAPVREHLRYNTDENETPGNINIYERINTPNSDIPAVTHVDYSSRIQTVAREDDPVYYELIEKFYELTSCPLVVNTSFNVRGEPIVCSAYDAYSCFMRTEMDALVIGNFILKKNEQNENIERWKIKFEPD